MERTTTPMTPLTPRAPIDRRALVSRADVRVSSIDTGAFLSVGNGETAFTADVTGLQTLSEDRAVDDVFVFYLQNDAKWGAGAINNFASAFGIALIVGGSNSSVAGSSAPVRSLICRTNSVPASESRPASIKDSLGSIDSPTSCSA